MLRIASVEKSKPIIYLQRITARLEIKSAD